MLSSGGAVRVTSFDMSPVVLLAAAVPVEGLAEPKRPDIVLSLISRRVVSE